MTVRRPWVLVPHVYGSATYGAGMTPNRNTPASREFGIEFGTLSDALEERSYPITDEDLLAAEGDHALEFPNGSETLRGVLGEGAGQTYESPADVREAVLTMVDSRAVGRRFYSDRTPPANGEDRRDDQLSF